MSEAVGEVQNYLRETIARAMAIFGASPTMSRIYAELFFSSKPLGLKELSEKTGYSVSTVASSLEAVERVTDVVKFKKPGSKKVYYECRHDIPSAIPKKVAGAREALHIMLDALSSAEERLKKEKTAQSRGMLSKINKLQKDYRSMERMLDKMLAFYEESQQNKK